MAGPKPGEPLQKTNVMRILEEAGAAYEALPYEYDEEELDAVHAAASAGIEDERLFKTIVARDETGQVRVFCIPGPASIDLKKAARAAGAKRIELAEARELKALTGYVRGGCSPVGMKKAYPTLIDEYAQAFDRVAVSAGRRGLALLIAPEDLARAAGARFADLCL